MKLFELLPCVDLPGQRGLTIAPPIDLTVKQALARLERRPSRQYRRNPRHGDWPRGSSGSEP